VHLRVDVCADGLSRWLLLSSGDEAPGGPLGGGGGNAAAGGVDKGRRALEATGRLTGTDSRRWWALW